MALTVQQLFTAPDAATFRAQMVSALVTVGVPADKWRAGGVASTMLTVFSMSLALLASLVTGFIQGFFLPTATGDSLKLLAQYVYGVTLPVATAASGPLTLVNAGGGVYTVAAGQFTALNPFTNVTYTNANAFVLPALTSIAITVRANVSGSAGNANPGEINTLITTMIGVTCSNPTSLVGIDPPTDEAIRTLCYNSLGIRSVRGVRSAYAYAVEVATNPITGAPVNVNRWAIVADSHVGTVNIYVASPSGAATSSDVTGVANSVEANARPECVTATVASATPVSYAPALIVWATLPSGTTSTAAATAAAAALTSYLASFPIGGVLASDDINPGFQGLFGSGVTGALTTGIRNVNGTLLSVQSATDLALTAGQVAVDAATITVRVVATTAGVVGSGS
jgi:hypothetical protein